VQRLNWFSFAEKPIKNFFSKIAKCFGGGY